MANAYLYLVTLSKIKLFNIDIFEQRLVTNLVIFNKFCPAVLKTQ